MSQYKVSKENLKKELLSLSELEGYTFKPKTKKDYLEIDDIKVVDKEMINNILSTKFSKTFKKLLVLALACINDDEADEGDVSIVLDEVELTREILVNRYKKFLSNQEFQSNLKKLRLLDNELRVKYMEIKKRAIYLEVMETEEKGMGGR